jgi:hypothetical protein
MKYRVCGRILAIVLLMSFWKTPVFGEPPTTQTPNSEKSGMKRYSESEVDCLAKLDLLIEDLTGAAEEAIEKAAAEAAKAATLASLEREAVAIREAQYLQGENSRLKQSRVKTAVVTGVVCFFGGLAFGAGSIAIIQGGR